MKLNGSSDLLDRSDPKTVLQNIFNCVLQKNIIQLSNNIRLSK